MDIVKSKFEIRAAQNDADVIRGRLGIALAELINIDDEIEEKDDIICRQAKKIKRLTLALEVLGVNVKLINFEDEHNQDKSEAPQVATGEQG